MQKKILYIDMDGVVADFDKGIKAHLPELETACGGDDYETRHQQVEALCMKYPTIFRDLLPIPMAVEAVKTLATMYDVYFLSTPMWCVPDSFMWKRVWLENHFGELAEKRLILTHRKDLAIGNFLVDDRIKHGVDKFQGEHIHYGTEPYNNWMMVMGYLYYRHKNG